MIDSGLDDLYQDVVMDHGGSPRNMRRVDDAQKAGHGFNPFCGDLIDVEVRLDDGAISDIGFTGKGCAISRASASLMTEAVTDHSVDEARKIFDAFRHMITGEGSGTENRRDLGRSAVSPTIPHASNAQCWVGEPSYRPSTKRIGRRRSAPNRSHTPVLTETGSEGKRHAHTDPGGLRDKGPGGPH